MRLIDREYARCLHFGQTGDIDHRSPTHIHLFHREQRGIHQHTVSTKDQGGILFQLKLRNTDEVGRCLNLWGQRLVAVFLKDLAQLVVLLRCPAVFVDWSIVVVGGDIGRKTWRICTSPVAETRSSVSHVKREADAFRQHLVDAAYHIVGRTGLMTCAPLVKPSAPELRTHHGSIRS